MIDKLLTKIDDLISQGNQFLSKYDKKYTYHYKRTPTQVEEFDKEFEKWKKKALSYSSRSLKSLDQTPENSSIFQDIEKASPYPIAYAGDTTNRYVQRAVDQVISSLEAIKDELEFELETLPEIDTSDNDSSPIINDLQNLLIEVIFEQIMKNPTLYHSKTRSFSPAKRNHILERDDYQCQICQHKFDRDDLEIDHIFPHSLEGSNEDYNLMALCEDCNLDKGRRLDFYNSDLGKEQLKFNIRKFTETLPMINNFGSWLKKVGDMRRRET